MMKKKASNRRHRTLWAFTVVTVVYFGHYVLFLSRLTPRFQRFLDTTINNGMLDLPAIAAKTGTYDSPSPRTTGFVSCLCNSSDRESVLQVLALAQSLQSWRDEERGWVLEIYHNGQLSRFLQAHLESQYASFVTVIDLSWYYEATSDDNLCLAQALKTASLKHALVVPSSIQFLQSPKSILLGLQEQHSQHQACQKEECRTCVTLATSGTNTQMDPSDLVDDKICQVPLASVFTKTDTVHHASLSKSTQIGTTHSSNNRMVWMEYSTQFLQWYSVNDYSEETITTTTIDGSISSNDNQILQKHLQQHQTQMRQARRLILMDRPIEWVAFDTGFHVGKSATLNTLQAANQSLQAGTKMLNIDIGLTSDFQLVAVHNDKSITPADFADSKLKTSIFQMPAKQAVKLISPCLPRDIVTSSLLPGNPYQPYHCQPEPVAFVSDFVRLVQEHDSKHRQKEPTEIILDLKAPQVALQIQQARILAKDIVPSLRGQTVAVRFFSVFQEEDRLAATVFPQEALQALRTDSELRGIGYYVNVPSKLACHQIGYWIQNQTGFINQNIRGCFVIQKHENIAASWREFTKENSINRFERPRMQTDMRMESQQRLKYICDVPRKQSFVNPSLWAKEYVRCVEDGFDYIHDPFPPPSSVLEAAMEEQEQSPRPISSIQDFGTLARRIIQRHLQRNQTNPRGNPQLIHWGFGTATDEIEYQWFAGSQMIKQSDGTTLLTKENRNMRCITKVLSVMLFLKFQEMGYLNINDKIVDGDNNTHPMTFRHVFSNVGGSNGTIIGKNFRYTNDLWYLIPGAFERITGMKFVDCVKEYVIEPMGLTGQYDATNKTMPPLAGRGYNGHPTDIAVIGATLAASGISPKTRKQVVSPESVQLMLQDTISTPNLTESFNRDKIVLEMDRLYNQTGLFPNGFCNGYGMGVWLVDGWRHTAQGLPIEAYLSQGSGMVYSDTTGLVISFRPNGIFTVFNVRSFVKIVRDIGNAILDFGPGTTVSPPQEQTGPASPPQEQTTRRPSPSTMRTRTGRHSTLLSAAHLAGLTNRVRDQDDGTGSTNIVRNQEGKREDLDREEKKKDSKRADARKKTKNKKKEN
ncbi:expressed unknown protein [Seminavis robusta]|uniref:Uncharacterized protein n=1 Tax=Seminavis robusta TaxID=568900 RepID=A0A9N8HM08_9STRA|nr:expressed unknown protein [Seminavis robusta]|eukprot:Sro713_g191570.1 n/a (1093) ;mRNA; r:19379-22657